MGKFFFIMMVLPLIAITLASFMGYLRTMRTSLFALLLVVIGYVAGFHGFMRLALHQDSWGFVQTLLGLALMFCGPWLSFFASLRIKRINPAPIDHVAKAVKDGAQATQTAWNDLDPAKKEKIIDVAKKMATHGIRHGARVLRRKGHLNLAVLILGALHII